MNLIENMRNFTWHEKEKGCVVFQFDYNGHMLNGYVVIHPDTYFLHGANNGDPHNIVGFTLEQLKEGSEQLNAEHKFLAVMEMFREELNN
ncbi:hypothetical protein COL23_25775 [Priestia aryabhattai]|uniref:hypothetical protein n=1 Tax=Priestia aryabhattai TaxID=412384 RepID=UPI000BF4467E|nr:hypothetical protein [Priestia aryabhattai]PFW72163.1 hypothetical protein COL23_25775 [Priestia aryabhattai]